MVYGFSFLLKKMSVLIKNHTKGTKITLIIRYSTSIYKK